MRGIIFILLIFRPFSMYCATKRYLYDKMPGPEIGLLIGALFRSDNCMLFSKKLKFDLTVVV